MNKIKGWAFMMNYIFQSGRHSGLMVSVLVYGASGPGLSSGRGHCVVFLSKTLYSHSASLCPNVYMGTGEFNAGGVTLRWTSIPFRGEKPGQKNLDKFWSDGPLGSYADFSFFTYLKSFFIIISVCHTPLYAPPK